MTAYAKPPVTPAWGETNTTSTDMVQPAPAAIQTGWPQSATPPARQYFNWLFNFCTAAVRYLCQRGLPDYDAAETYQLNARIIGDDGLTYVSIQNANIGHTPSTQPTWWTRWGFTLAQLGSTLVTLAGFVIQTGMPGYIKLPTVLGGFIIQWVQGGSQSSGAGGSSYTLNFPLAFPNACFGAIAGLTLVSGGGVNYAYNVVGSPTKTQVTIASQNFTTPSGSSQILGTVFAVGN